MQKPARPSTEAQHGCGCRLAVRQATVSRCPGGTVCSHQDVACSVCTECITHLVDIEALMQSVLILQLVNVFIIDEVIVQVIVVLLHAA